MTKFRPYLKTQIHDCAVGSGRVLNFIMSEIKISRGEKILQRFVGERKLTPSGADWLVTALDPFHDSMLKNLRGWPDIDTTPSVVRNVKQSITITKNSLLPPGNWDCHIVAWPWHTSIGMGRVTTRSNNTWVTTAAMANAPTGGVQAYQMASGTNLSIESALNQQLILNDDFTTGAGRLVGMGFEVSNTTATIQKQGSCHVYRQASNTQDSFTGVYTTPGPPGVGVGSFTAIRYPPQNTAQAMLIPGSRQWPAEEGCYVVCAFNDLENPAKPVSYSCPVINDPISDDQENQNVPLPVVNTSPITVITPQNGVVGTLRSPAMKIDPINQSGVIFSGLSDVSTLTLNVNYFYEVFPGVGQQDVLVLATPSAQYDPIALEVYSHAISTMPVGVKFNENGLGDWFMGVVSKIGSFLSPVLTALPHPLAKAAGVGLGAISESMTEYMAPPNANVPKGKPVVKKALSPPPPPLPARSPANGYVRAVDVPPRGSKQRKNLAKLTTRQLMDMGWTRAQAKEIHS